MGVLVGPIIFITSCKTHIDNEFKVYDINIEVRNRIGLNLVGQELKVTQNGKIENRPSLNI